MTSLLTGLLGAGPAATVTHIIPDRHHFRGSFGGKDVIPLWRDAAATEPNVTAGLLDELGAGLGREVSPEELFAYCYAVLCAPGYVERFLDELEVPGPRVPLTSDPGLFGRAVELGERLIWLHSYGERLVPAGRRVGEVPQGTARAEVPVSGDPERYPESHSYDGATRKLRVGDGVFAPVPPAVRAYSVSGLDVIGSWLDYRLREGAGRRSSQLDRIRPLAWTAAFTEGLLRLLWIVEHTVVLAPELNETLDRVAAGPMIEASRLPSPSAEERRAPTD